MCLPCPANRSTPLRPVKARPISCDTCWKTFASLIDPYLVIIVPQPARPAHHPLLRVSSGFEPARLPFGSGLRNQSALVGDRAEHCVVARTSEEPHRPALERGLFARRRAALGTVLVLRRGIGTGRTGSHSHDAVNVRSEDASTEDIQRVADVADREPGDRLPASTCMWTCG